MKLERNVKAQERRVIVRHIHYRKHKVEKDGVSVRVTGHKMNVEKLHRWMKEEASMMNQLVQDRPISPIPSEISIYTKSHLGSPTLIPSSIPVHQGPGVESISMNKKTNAVIHRLLTYTHTPNMTMKSEQTSAVFNDLQLILSSGSDFPKCPSCDVWSLAIEEDIVKVRNLINLTSSISFTKESQELDKTRLTGSTWTSKETSSRVGYRHASWRTPYGRVQASFWQVSGPFEHDGTEPDNSGHGSVSARIAILPNRSAVSSFRVVFDFDPRLNPSATLTYQAIIPNDSEVFRIIEYGEIEELLECLDNKTATLTDRDEQGRSLLNYAITFARVDMCRFLLDRKADPNAIELNHGGFLGPVFEMQFGLDAEIETLRKEEELNRISECYKLMLQAGADCSLETYMGDDMWYSTLIIAVYCYCSTKLKHIISYGEPFINPRSLFNYDGRNLCSPLAKLAHNCGYDFGESIHVVEKAILLLKWGVDISYRLPDGDTVLHSILKCYRYHESLPRRFRRLHVERCSLSRTEPRELLITCITAGANVYARNEAGYTPSAIASTYDREKEWLEALEFCGYDSKEVMEQTCHNCDERRGLPQTSKLSFEEYCQQREIRMKTEEKYTFEEMGSEEEDEYSDEWEDGDEEEDRDEVEDQGGEEDQDEEEDRDEQRENDFEESFAAVLANMGCENSNLVESPRELLHDPMFNERVEQIDRIGPVEPVDNWIWPSKGGENDFEAMNLDFSGDFLPDFDSPMFLD